MLPLEDRHAGGDELDAISDASLSYSSLASHAADGPIYARSGLFYAALPICTLQLAGLIIFNESYVFVCKGNVASQSMFYRTQRFTVVIQQKSVVNEADRSPPYKGTTLCRYLIRSGTSIVTTQSAYVATRRRAWLPTRQGIVNSGHIAHELARRLT
eukprot:6188290-Pleurochrysis_carterae.AAC.4